MAISIVNSKDEFDKIIKKNKICVCDFSAYWCGPCRMLAPVIEEISDENQNITFINVDVDQGQQLAMEFNIDAVPTIIVFKDGKPVNRVSGFMPKGELDKFINNSIS